MFKYITDRKLEGGFTLVELMVVILIIAILLAVAIPVFLNARNRAVVRAAQSRLKQVVNASKEVAGGGSGAAGAITGTESGIVYGSQNSGDLQGELDTITLVTAAPSGVEVRVVPNTPVGGITFTTYDANGTLRTAIITDTGIVSIN